jgi:hypothetical protein
LGEDLLGFTTPVLPSSFFPPHPTNATTAIIKRICFMSERVADTIPVTTLNQRVNSSGWHQLKPDLNWSNPSRRDVVDQE